MFKFPKSLEHGVSFFFGFYSVFGGVSWFLVVYLGFYSGFELLITKTTVTTKKKLTLRDSCKIMLFLSFLVFCSGFGGVSWFLVVFPWFLQWFQAPEHENHSRNSDKTMHCSISQT